MGIAWLPEGRSKGFGKDNSRSAALPEQPPTKDPSCQDSVAELKAQDPIICKAEERRFTHHLFSPPGNSHCILGTDAQSWCW